ncbi:ribosome-binding factor A [Comamonas sp. JC664]|uniref:ribosome-binding factor A n=1 Tax=Comamonas sp. JC664 TaxID=2801917 RepID=UPI00174869AA|nr:ribosome-binding factor A [Comamonas sp. JC664]MBL0698422.1 ribosome-binding factor A [Comamonas sp. JC664]
MSSSRNRRQPASRHLRVQSHLSQEVARTFRGELSDPMLEGVALTSFELAPDGRLVRIGYTVTPEAAASGLRPVQRALDRASGYLRSQLAEHLDLKRAPQLRFIYIGVSERLPGEEEGAS